MSQLTCMVRGFGTPDRDSDDKIQGSSHKVWSDGFAGAGAGAGACVGAARRNPHFPRLIFLLTADPWKKGGGGETSAHLISTLDIPIQYWPFFVCVLASVNDQNSASGETESVYYKLILLLQVILELSSVEPIPTHIT